MPSPLELSIPKGQTNAIKSEKQTPFKEEEMIANLDDHVMENLTPMNDASSKKMFEPSEIVSHEDIDLQTAERAVSPSDAVLMPSTISGDLEFEEAVNTEQLSVPTNSPGTTTPASGLNSRHVTMKQVQISPATTVGSADLTPPVKKLIPGGGKMYDIDSLNEVKRANDSHTKTFEITNRIFDMLIGEIKDNLFPLRDEEGEDGKEVKDLSKAKKKKKSKKVPSRVKKPDVLPKIKEIKNGVPVNACLKRI